MIFTIADLGYGNHDERLWEWDNFSKIEIGSTKYYDNNGVEISLKIIDNDIVLDGVIVTEEEFTKLFTIGGYTYIEKYREFKPFEYYNEFGDTFIDIYVGF